MIKHATIKEFKDFLDSYFTENDLNVNITLEGNLVNLVCELDGLRLIFALPTIEKLVVLLSNMLETFE